MYIMHSQSTNHQYNKTLIINNLSIDLSHKLSENQQTLPAIDARESFGYIFCANYNQNYLIYILLSYLTPSVGIECHLLRH